MAEIYVATTQYPPEVSSIVLSEIIVDDLNYNDRIDQMPRLASAGRQLGKLLGDQVVPPTLTRVVEIAETALNEVRDIETNVTHTGHRTFLTEVVETALPLLDERIVHV
jgi:hypothetical protein